MKGHQMKQIGVVFLGASLLLGFGSARSSEFPPKVTYVYFIQGQPGGKSDITVTLDTGKYVISSTQDLKHGDFQQVLTCRTELDQKTLRPLLFTYKGRKNGVDASGTLRIQGSDALGDFVNNGTPYTGKMVMTDPTYIFQNYVPEHLMVVARHLVASNKLNTRFTILFPSDMTSLPVTATNESEVELPTRPSPIVCRKFSVSLQGAAPFFMYVDPKRNLPVYMDFPAAQTEAFLQSAYGDRPQTHYVVPTKPQHE